MSLSVLKNNVFGSIMLIGGKKYMLGGPFTACSHGAFVKVMIRENYIKFAITYK